MLTNYFYTDGLESERIKTRFLNQEDIPAWGHFFENKEATRFLPDFGFENQVQKANHMIGKQITRYSENRYGLQALIEKENKQFLGMCGLLKQDVEGVEELEIGYHLFRENWGKGYASEAAQLFKHFAFQNKLADSVTSIIDVENTRSQNVALSNGMTLEKQIRWMEWDVFIYRVKVPVE